MLGHNILAGGLASVFLSSGGFNQLVCSGQVVGVIDLLVGDVPPLPQHRLLVRVVMILGTLERPFTLTT